jgi:hypothetical protein
LRQSLSKKRLSKKIGKVFNHKGHEGTQREQKTF